MKISGNTSNLGIEMIATDGNEDESQETGLAQGWLYCPNQKKQLKHIFRMGWLVKNILALRKVVAGLKVLVLRLQYTLV